MHYSILEKKNTKCPGCGKVNVGVRILQEYVAKGASPAITEHAQFSCMSCWYMTTDGSMFILEGSSAPETRAHIERVDELMTGRVAEELFDRGRNHDKSKLEEPELSVFDEVTPKLKELTYGSDEYKAMLAKMKPALEHHYAHNRHHPEHFQDGIKGMTLVDLVEMFCDWKAATERHADGDIFKSLTINDERFDLGPQLFAILWNTAQWLQKIENDELDEAMENSVEAGPPSD